MRNGLLIICFVGAALSLAVLLDAGSRGSIACRGVEAYLTSRWNQTLGIEAGEGGPGQTGPAVDELLAGLPAPPKSLRVLRGQDLRALGRAPGEGPPSNASGDAKTAAREAGSGCAAFGGGGPYALRLRGLLRALRVFAACNFGLFLLTAVMVGRSRGRVVECLVPAAVLAATTLTASILYLVARDWFWSFVDGDFVGVGYLLIAGLVASLLADIVWNRGRVVRFVLRLLWWVPV